MKHVELAKALHRYVDSLAEPNAAVLDLCSAVAEADRVPAPNSEVLNLAKACLPEWLGSGGTCMKAYSCVTAPWIDNDAALRCAEEEINRMVMR
jgi:hypothetical protein